MKDNITCAVKSGEVTLAILADFSKAFDTVAYKTVLNKLHHLGFSKSFIRWVTGPFLLLNRAQVTCTD